MSTTAYIITGIISHFLMFVLGVVFTLYQKRKPQARPASKETIEIVKSKSK